MFKDVHAGQEDIQQPNEAMKPREVLL